VTGARHPGRMEVCVRDVRFRVHDDEHAAFWDRVVSGDWEPDSFTVLDHFLAAGRVFVDVGAWIGPLTLYGASIAGSCHAVEPDPVARAALRANLDLNPHLAGRVRVHVEAVAAAPGAVRLGNITSAGGGDSMSSLLFAGAPCAWAVDGVRLDQLLATIPEADLGLVKMDVEGAEVEILDGSRAYLEAHRPPLFLSVHARFWADPEPRLRLLADLLSGYDRLLTPRLQPMDVVALFDDEHRHGLFELVAV
jgi:FkbM family methyltransferase